MPFGTSAVSAASSARFASVCAATSRLAPRVTPVRLPLLNFGVVGCSSRSDVRCFSALRSMQSLASTKRKATGHFNNDYFGGSRPTETNHQLTELPKSPREPQPYELKFAKYPGLVSGLGGEYYFREDQKHPLTYYHMKSPASGDTVVVGATASRALEARTIDNYLKERTRGFAVQIVLEGRGVKAYFEPKYPILKARLGVGAKVVDLTEYVLRDPDCMVSVNKKGDIVCVHGPNKARVGTLAYRLLKKMQPPLLPYTGKGAHFAFYQPRRKAVQKK
eukprot:TRINITY_DN74982_c0_g1_i1.p1 TRINITY_DN74982_c0_g1~~TRINITY_DN74982_c0_g1_i1.p1  ORF type:complete len:294 (+),score=45.30 TRINITY_DN74982_c0_g1_i1:52-882(+)